MQKYKYILFILLFISTFISYSQEVKTDMYLKIASEYLQKQESKHSIKNSRFLSQKKNQPRAIVYDLTPQGFIIIGMDTQKVLGFSFNNNFSSIDSQEFSLTMDLVQYLVFTQKNGAYTNANKSEDEEYGPYVYNMWGQVNCTDNVGNTINVTNLYSPSNYAAGCVAISQASILKHYNWPPRGMGIHSYTDNSGSSTGSYAVSYKDFQYDWVSALDRYRGKASEEEERDVAGLIAYHSAVSLEMDFEYNGSTSNVNRIPGALAENFRFTSLYKSRTSSVFWSLLDSNMVWEKPVILAVETSNGSGHSVVCDGLKIEDGEYLYHLNMGWWGTSNGWYKLRNSFNAGGYNYVIGGTMNILPEPYVEVPVMWDDATIGQLCWSHPENADAEAFEVQRIVDEGVWETLTDVTTDTCWTIFPQMDKEYSFRVRAKTNGRWYNNSWSEAVPLVWSYTGLSEVSNINLSSQPNPFKDQLTIRSNTTGSYQINIFNAAGQIVYSTDGKNQEIIIDSSNWPSGIYSILFISKTESKTIKSIRY